jgi:hypothetical protein
MGNCLKKPSGKEKLLQLDKNYKIEKGKGKGSLYDNETTVYTEHWPRPVRPRGPTTPLRYV